MSNTPEDKPQGQAGEGKRPYATLDLKATEVESSRAEKPAEEPKPEATASPEATAAAPAPKPEKRNGMGLVTHAVAGVAGAAAVLLAMELVTSNREAVSRQGTALTELTRRIGEMERAVGGKQGAEGTRARLDELSRTLAGLSEAQTKLAAEARSLDTRVGAQEIPPGLAERLTKIDEILATVPNASAGREPSPAAKALLSRVDGELSDLRTETGRLSQRIDVLRGEVDERLKGAARTADVTPLAGKVATMEKDVQTFTRSEADRNANASRIVLLLELGNLKRALDTGRPYPSEMAAVQKVAAGKLNLAPIERYVLDGVPPMTDLTKEFRKVANKMIDAEAEPANATLVDRLVSGAKSVVRVRKSGHPADDMSAEAVVGRMEAALKEGRLAEVLAQGKKLPPKAALAGESWLKQVEARQSVNAAVADIETALKTSLGGAGK